MSLNGEANELRNMWTSASWPLKGWLVLSFFISISSLASLSETIIKWRSFFRDAVHFYQEWIGEPLKELFFYFLYRYGACYDKCVRHYVPNGKCIWRMRLTIDPELRSPLFPFVFNGIFSFGWLIYLNRQPMTWPPQAVEHWIWLAGLIIAFFVPAAYRFRNMWAFYLPILSSILVIGVLAAINAGLSR